jgi:hypothetical protein
MQSVRFLVLAALLVGQTACEDDPMKSEAPGEPTPPTTGIQAYLQVDDGQAQVGDRVRISVRVQIGTDSETKVGSYTGRLVFDPEALSYMDEIKVNDGLRVSNPGAAEDGVIRFAGAAARGFDELRLYEAVFQVRKASYVDGLRFEMEEVSEALSLNNLRPQLKAAPEVFFRKSPR